MAMCFVKMWTNMQLEKDGDEEPEFHVLQEGKGGASKLLTAGILSLYIHDPDGPRRQSK